MNCVVSHFLKQQFFFHSSAEEDTIIISFCPVISMDLSSVTRSTLHNVCWHKRNNMLLSVEKSLMHCKLFGCLWLLLTQTSVTQKQALFSERAKQATWVSCFSKAEESGLVIWAHQLLLLHAFIPKSPNGALSQCVRIPPGIKPTVLVAYCLAQLCLNVSTNSLSLKLNVWWAQYIFQTSKSSIQCSCLKNLTRFLFKSDWHLSQRDLHRISHIVRLRIHIILRKTTQS